MSLDVIDVAVGVLEDASGKVLLARRPNHAHQGGLWEFPGGKINTDETVYDALVREFAEEVGVTIQSSEALVDVTHDYGDRQVRLCVHYITHFEGEPYGREGQALAWVHTSALGEYPLPAANQAIIDALRERLA